MPSVTIHPRCDSTTCIQCRRAFQPGDRITVAHIVVKTGRNEATRELGAFLSDEFELSHVNCADPQLSGQVVVP